MADDPAAIVAGIDARATRSDTACGNGCVVWRAWGDGPPLVLLHGAVGSWTHWLRNVLPLAERFSVLAPDMPGFGDSDMPPEPYTADSLADLLSAALDRVLAPPRPLALAGFSFGGILAGLVAARQGARVHTLLLLGPNGLRLPVAPIPPLRRPEPGMSDADVRAVHRDNLAILMLADPRRVDDLAVHLQAENVRRARVKSGDIPRSDVLLRALPRVKARLAGIWGAADAFARNDLDARRRVLARFQPGLDFRVVPGAGHWACYEAPAAVNAAIVEILGG